MPDNKKIMCPSSRAHVGSKLLGIRQNDGTVAILPQPLLIGEDFIREAGKTSPPEQRFRFTSKCAGSGCAQWTGKRCGVADKILSVIEDLPVSKQLPDCEIRPQCRWHIQNGADACKVCPFVVTHTTEADWNLRDSINPQKNST